MGLITERWMVKAEWVVEVKQLLTRSVLLAISH
jgi:hypothetical protein